MNIRSENTKFTRFTISDLLDKNQQVSVKSNTSDKISILVILIIIK